MFDSDNPITTSDPASIVQVISEVRDAVGVALLRILGTTPEVTNSSIFEQEQIKRAVELGIGIASPDEIEFITDSEESEELVKRVKEELAK